MGAYAPFFMTPVEKASLAILRRLGIEGAHRGEPALIILKRNVETIDDYGSVIDRITTITLDARRNPQRGDDVVLSGEQWKLDALVKQSGLLITYSARFA